MAKKRTKSKKKTGVKHSKKPQGVKKTEVAKKRQKSAKKPSRAKFGKLLPMLQSLHKASPRHRSVLLSHLDNSSVDALCETAHNVLCNPALPTVSKRRLKKTLAPYKSELRYIANKKNSQSNKKKRIVRMGGFPWGALLGVGIPMLMNLFKGKKR